MFDAGQIALPYINPEDAGAGSLPARFSSHPQIPQISEMEKYSGKGNWFPAL